MNSQQADHEFRLLDTALSVLFVGGLTFASALLLAVESVQALVA